ncbi:hypothetical protein Tco_0394165 [Tanacetum coccineum]
MADYDLIGAWGPTIITARVFLEGTPRWGTYNLNTCRVFLEGTPMRGTHYFYYCPGVLGGNTYDGIIMRESNSSRILWIDIPVVESNQHDDFPIILEPVLVDEDEDPEHEEFEEEEEPQKER